MAPSDTVFNKNFFESGKSFSQSTYTPKFNFVPKLQRDEISHLSPYSFLLNLQKKNEKNDPQHEI